VLNLLQALRHERSPVAAQQEALPGAAARFRPGRPPDALPAGAGPEGERRRHAGPAAPASCELGCGEGAGLAGTGCAREAGSAGRRTG
jgi:hypothetical protein